MEQKTNRKRKRRKHEHPKADTKPCKALAATAVRQGTAVAARLLDVKKKASPPI